MQHTALALRTVWYIYTVKTDSLTAGRIQFYPSSKRNGICPLHQCTVREGGSGQTQTEEKNKTNRKSAVVSMVRIIHLMG